ncbi:MAG TPA: NAD-dependent dehydratase [Stenotrophomonas sp.]|jgi:uncharacterized protein YbjT (DUF2867 family)
MRLLLAGATGLVGRHSLQRLLEDPRCSAVVAPTRRPLDIAHPKLDNPVLDFEQLRDPAPQWHVQAAICALGTTIKQAGSREAFHRVDHDYPWWLAQALHANGTECFVLNSALGADPASRIFYNRVKGELERDLRTLGFPSLTLVRPGLIGGNRTLPRTGEQFATVLLTTLAPVLPRRWRINPATQIAQAMIEAALASRPGLQIIDSSQLVA